MQRIDENRIELSDEEIDQMASFIWDQLYREWDRYTDNYIVRNTTTDEGMRRMDPDMYDFMVKLRGL